MIAPGFLKKIHILTRIVKQLNKVLILDAKVFTKTKKKRLSLVTFISQNQKT